jgi:hypothetical protein
MKDGETFLGWRQLLRVLREWMASARCNHAHGKLLAIEFDGEAVYECVACGKRIRKPL